MRLINTTSELFEEFIGSNIPSYAILSHTWGDDEISFNDFNNPTCKTKKGFEKISMTCKLASQAGIGYAWVDTCCIDKSSSAELTEAINSMFRWYSRAQVCYVYLSDLPPQVSVRKGLPHCRWLTRGWTLQELIAPADNLFYDEIWTYRGDKFDLLHDLVAITEIDYGVLNRDKPLSQIAVAQRMSWAARRDTTRIEDSAYCLLGIFNVQMPMLYGEENQAFQRLQREIIKSIPDLSIFSWTLPDPSMPLRALKQTNAFTTILAHSPRQFSKQKSTLMLRKNDQVEFSVTNKGVKIDMSLLLAPIPGKQGSRYLLPVSRNYARDLNCLRLRKCGPSTYARENAYELMRLETGHGLWKTVPRSRYLCCLNSACNMCKVCLHHDLIPADLMTESRRYVLQVRVPSMMKIASVWPWSTWDDQDQLFFTAGDDGSDRGSAKIKGILELETDDRTIALPFECLFYALAWGGFMERRLQCTIVDRQLGHSLNDIRTQFVEHDQKVDELRENLIYHKIPQSPFAVFKIPNTTLSAVVSFRTSRLTNRDICTGPFWSIEFFWTACEDDKLPRIHDGKWE